MDHVGLHLVRTADLVGRPTVAAAVYAITHDLTLDAVVPSPRPRRHVLP